MILHRLRIVTLIVVNTSDIIQSSRFFALDSQFRQQLLGVVAFDKDGNEQEGGEMSQKLVDVLANESITDVFIFSHGGMGDVPAARHQ